MQISRVFPLETELLTDRLLAVIRAVLAWSCCLLTTLLLLILWRYRFEPIPNQPSWSLSDLQHQLPPTPGISWVSSTSGPTLRVELHPTVPRVVTVLPLTSLGPTPLIHVKSALRSDHLIPGELPWMDGRLLLEWRSARGMRSHDPVGSCQYELENSTDSRVLRSEVGEAMPFLRIEHIGRSGAFEVSQLELMAVQETQLWRWGRWLLAGAWLVAVTLILRSHLPTLHIRNLLSASTLWIILAVNFVVPGPWKDINPLLLPFALAPASAAHTLANQTAPTPTLDAQPTPTSMHRAAVEPGSASESVGKLPEKGSLILKIKLHLRQFRLLLHALLLAGPTCLLALLTGYRPAAILACSLSALIELAQLSFGYGSDVTDLADLACDACGIGIGLLAARWIIAKNWKPITWIRS